jgi:hypothetical protein
LEDSIGLSQDRPGHDDSVGFPLENLGLYSVIVRHSFSDWFFFPAFDFFLPSCFSLVFLLRFF